MASPLTALKHDDARFPGLDALRGLAILMVVAGHYLPGRVLTGDAADIVRPFALGGVALFLLLSGFLIEHNLARDHDLRAYALRRVFRIFPAYWVALAVLIAIDRLFIHAPDYAKPSEVAANALLMSDLLGAKLMSGVFWTLLVEIKFYLIAPLIVRTGRAAVVCAPIALIALNGAMMVWRGEASSLMTYLACCLVGMNFSLWRRKELPTAYLCGLAAALAMSLFLFSPYYKAGLLLFGIGNALALGFALRGANPPASLGLVGAVSYSWYLYHAGVGYPMMGWLESAGGVPAALSVIIVLAVTFLLAWVSYRFVELPGIGIGRAIVKGSSARRPATASPASE